LITSGLDVLKPAPTRHIPVLIGGGERKALRIVAERADIWHGFGDAATVAHKDEVLERWCAKIGRDLLEIERSADVSPKAPPASAEGLRAVGTRLFTYGVEGPDYDLGPLRDLIAWRDERNRR
jgi:alkanesulfonate monooxygenase SsuD/methylene tetrahydromethanopterin reductase-like flavin-dependent oxidoreductase (luciferase family)